MEYKKEYTKQELLALRDWFVRNRQRLPKTLVLNPGVSVTDMDTFVGDVMAKLEHPNTHVAQTGLMHTYFQIQAKLKEQLGDGPENN